MDISAHLLSKPNDWTEILQILIVYSILHNLRIWLIDIRELKYNKLELVYMVKANEARRQKQAGKW